MIISGKEGTLTERDEAILTDLYFTRMLSTEQIALLYFPSEAAAKQRLYQLRRYKGVVEPLTLDNGTTLWTLTKPAFWRKAEFAYRDDRYRGFPEKRFIPHMKDANDIYVGIRKDLDRMLGEHPAAWQWKDEARLWEQRNSKGNALPKDNTKKNQPDGEVTFDGHRYLLERQTERAKASRRELDEKVDGYRRYFGRLGAPDGDREVLFACDLQRDRQNLMEAAEKHDVDLSAGTVEEVISYLIHKGKQAKSAKVSQ